MQYIIPPSVDVNGQINHKAALGTMPERFPQMSHHELETGENMISWNSYNQSYSRNPDQQRVGQTSHETSFYEDEYQKMASSIDKKLISAKNFNWTADPYGELVHQSLLADQKHHGDWLSYVGSSSSATPSPTKGKKKVSFKRLLRMKRYIDEKNELFMLMARKLEMQNIERCANMQIVRKQRKMNSAHDEFEKDLMDSSTSEQPEVRMSNTAGGDSSITLLYGDFMRSSVPEEDDSIGGTQDTNARKGRAQCRDFSTESKSGFMVNDTRPSFTPKTEPLDIKKQKVQRNATKKTKMSACRHFKKGYCRQGEMCTFQHREEDSNPDTQKVFLGGLPHSITPAKLSWELSQQGYNVVNQPNIFRGFSPQVCLSSTVEAMKMLEKGKIIICGHTVDVRPYNASTMKERDRQLYTDKRSVFLGGLPSSVNLKILNAEFKKLGMKMINRPRIRRGFIPKLTLASVTQAEKLVAKGTILISGAVINVRAYKRKT